MQQANIKYTFLLPAYKADFLKDALLSIKEQSFSNFRVIVSDDCSPYRLKEIFDKAVGCDGRFEYRRNNTNMGGAFLTDHWNLLLNICKTEYLILASDDDLYAADFLSEVDLLTCKYPNVNLIRARVRRISSDGVTIGIDAPTEEFESQIDYLYGLYVLRRIKCIGNYVFKTNVLKNEGGFERFPLAWGSDDATVMKMCRNGACITPSVLFEFRLSGKNISSKADKNLSREKVKARMQSLEKFDDFISGLTTEGTLLTEYRRREFVEFFNTTWTSNIITGSVFLPFGDFLNCYKFLNRRKAFSGTLDKLHFMWAWLRAIKI